MKNVSKNKFLTCFRPVADFDTTMHESRPAIDRANSRRFSCIPLGDKHEKKNSETNSSFPEQGYHKFIENWVVPQPPKKRTLVKVIKAMVVQTILLNKRAQHKNRYSHDCFGSSKRGYSDSESSSTGDEKKSMKVYKYPKIKEIKANNKLCMSSSSSSSTSSESKKISKHDNAKNQLEKLDKFKCFGICLVLISLAVTIHWGKYYGIIFTSTWLCFLSLWNPSYGKLRNTVSKGFMN